MKRYINYLIILVIVLFGGVSRVEAATEMVCKYTNGSNDAYLYCADKSADKCSTVYVERKGDESTFTMKKVKTVVFGTDDTCPTYANTDSNLFGVLVGFKFGKGSAGKEYTLEEENYEKKYTSWNLSGETTDVATGIVSYNVNYNQFGFLSFTSEGAKDSIVINNFNGSKPKFDSITDTGAIKFVTVSNVDNNLSASGNDNSNSGSDTTSATSGNGSLGSGSTVFTEEENVLGTGRYCLYKNFGYCSGDDGDINGDCGAFDNSSGKKDSWFVRAPYAIIKYKNDDISSGKIEGVYLPKSTKSKKDAFIVDSKEFAGFETVYNSFNGSRNQLNSMIVNYFDEIIPGDEIAILESAEISEETKDGCPTWFVETSGAGGQDYEDNMYFYQYYNTNPEDNSHSEESDVADDGVVVDQLDGPYFCVYNATYGTATKKEGEIVLKYNSEKTLLTLFSDDFSGAFHTYTCHYDDCKNPSSVSFSGYGSDSSESNPNGLFQSNIVSGVCPKYIGYLQGILTVCNSDSAECLNGEASYFGEYSYFTNNYVSGSSSDQIDISCNSLMGDLKPILKDLFNLMKVVVPIILGVFGTIDFVSAIFASKEDDMRKAQSKFIKRLVIAVAFFLIPTFINILLDVADEVWGWTSSDCIEEVIVKE